MPPLAQPHLAIRRSATSGGGVLLAGTVSTVAANRSPTSYSNMLRLADLPALLQQLRQIEAAVRG